MTGSVAVEDEVALSLAVDPVALALWLAVFLVIGALRPRWTTTLIAVVPLLLGSLWLLLGPDIGVAAMTWLDRAWLLGMAVANAAACALACATGVAARRFR